MKHCPNCINEYRDDVNVDMCPDCGVALLDGPNPRFNENPENEAELKEDLVELTRVGEQWQADFLIETLANADIVANQVPGEQSTLLRLPPIEVTGMIKLYVSKEDKERAVEILKEIDEDESTDIVFCSNCFNQIEKDVTVCPHCGMKLETE